MENSNGELSVLVNFENSLKVFRNDDRVLILFILEAKDGSFKVCAGVGDSTKVPIGQHTWELYTVSSRAEAEQTISDFGTILNYVLDPDDADHVVRGAFDR